jgi:hypothetical protein
MAVADILYFGLLAGVTLGSTFVLLGQFLRGDLAGRSTTTRRHSARVAAVPRLNRAAAQPQRARPRHKATPHAFAR